MSASRRRLRTWWLKDLRTKGLCWTPALEVLCDGPFCSVEIEVSAQYRMSSDSEIAAAAAKAATDVLHAAKKGGGGGRGGGGGAAGGGGGQADNAGAEEAKKKPPMDFFYFPGGKTRKPIYRAYKATKSCRFAPNCIFVHVNDDNTPDPSGAMSGDAYNNTGTAPTPGSVVGGASPTKSKVIKSGKAKQPEPAAVEKTARQVLDEELGGRAIDNDGLADTPGAMNLTLVVHPEFVAECLDRDEESEELVQRSMNCSRRLYPEFQELKTLAHERAIDRSTGNTVGVERARKLLQHVIQTYRTMVQPYDIPLVLEAGNLPLARAMANAKGKPALPRAERKQHAVRKARPGLLPPGRLGFVPTRATAGAQRNGKVSAWKG